MISYLYILVKGSKTNKQNFLSKGTIYRSFRPIYPFHIFLIHSQNLNEANMIDLLKTTLKALKSRFNVITFNQKTNTPFISQARLYESSGALAAPRVIRVSNHSTMFIKANFEPMANMTSILHKFKQFNSLHWCKWNVSMRKLTIVYCSSVLVRVLCSFKQNEEWRWENE